MGLWVSAGCWHTAHKPGNITMRLRGALMGTLCDRVAQYVRQARRSWCGQAVSGRILFLHDYNTYILVSVVIFIVSLGL
jgi:hypothetical protein